MKQDKTVKQAGPYHVTSHSQGRGIVYFMVYPAFPKYDNSDFKWAESRYAQKGGGPSMFTSMDMAEAMSEFLNSVYNTTDVSDWKRRIEAILKDEAKSYVLAECDKCGTLSNVSRDWIYCPVCGKPYSKDKT